MLTDPTLWLAVACWLSLFVVAMLCLMVGAARDDRILEQERRLRDVIARDREHGVLDLGEVEFTWPDERPLAERAMDSDGLGWGRR